MLEIRLAGKRGYCFGVKRAIEMTERALNEGTRPIWTLGPIIHNPTVVKELTERGVKSAKDLSEVTCGTLVLRAHGTTASERDRLSPKIDSIIDATCPFVTRALRKAAEFSSAGEKVLIIGDKNHPEVQAILSYAGQGAMCVSKPEDVNAIAFDNCSGNIEVIAQTTSRKENVEKILKSLKKKGFSVNLSNTICTATEERQEATRKLASGCDLVLVVGGRTSANTGQLLNIARECGTEAYLVESADDVLPEWLEGKHIVGVAAGASTPDRVIKEVVGKVEELEKTNADVNPEDLQEEEQEQGEVQVPAQETAPEQPQEAAEPEEKTAEELYDESFKTLREGDIVKGKVMSVDENGALVDVGYKSEGVISAQELDRQGVIGSFELSPGDEIMVYVLSVDSGEGSLRLSKRKADEEEAWRNLEQAYREQSTVEAPVAQEVKGGLVVDVGVRAFVPASQVERGYVNNLSKYVGQNLRMRVLELDRSKNRVILSQRVVLEEEHEKLCSETWDSIAEGQVRAGTVKGITEFGVFVDLGGVDGLLHISELSWGRINHPSEVVHEGQELEVKVLKVDKEKGRISLGRKQVLPDPWDDVETKYPVGADVKGEVTRTAPFGAFVQIEPGVEGLVHISEISQHHIAKPEEVVNSGDQVMVKILRTRPDERKISLSIKQADQFPLESTESYEEEFEDQSGEPVQEPDLVEPEQVIEEASEGLQEYEAEVETQVEGPEDPELEESETDEDSDDSATGESVEF